MTETYTQRWISLFSWRGYLFKDASRLKTRKWHDTKNKAKPNRVKTKRLMCLWTSEWRSVSRDWTARCSLNIQSEEEIETYWHENLGALRQSRGWTVSMCLCVRVRDVRLPPEHGACWSNILAFEVGLSSRVEKQRRTHRWAVKAALNCSVLTVWISGSLVHWY